MCLCSSFDSCASFLTGWLPGNPFKCIPLASPALKQHGCAIDYDLVASRVMFAAFAALGIVVAGAVVSAIFPAVGGFMILGAPAAYLLPAVDGWLSERAADRNAVNEYIQQIFPSKEATSRIQTSVSAAKLLVHEKANLNKLNADGESLLTGIRDAGILEILIDGGIDIKAKLQSDRKYFERLLKYDDRLPCAEVILKTHNLQPTDLSVEEQQLLWLSVGSSQAANLLKQYGFDVNIQKEDGYTALLCVADDKKVSGRFLNPDRKALAALLLNCGAQRSVNLSDGTSINAADLTKDNTLRAIFNQA